MTPATCPRCDEPLRAPGLMSSSWDCDRHGAVQPLRRWTRITPEVVAQAARKAAVPLWSPLPLLPGWTVTGLAMAGDERGGARATVLALSGPSPLGGPADMLLIAEEPGVGLGAHLAGGDGLDPGDVTQGPPEAKVEAAGHPTALWRWNSADDRVAFVGEASGVWLYAVLWPPAAELVLLEHVQLHDLRHETHVDLELPIGAPTARLGSPVDA
ncbi:MAG: putative phosphotransacetylase [Frankiales bacterium]|jgi:hypothetical protein|nr:putative phosphotransacetylase [Frankiales bacterium]